VNRKMKRSLGVGTVLALLLAVAVLAAGVAPAFALTKYYEYESASATAVINLPNHQPEMELVCQHFESSSDHGPGNQMFLFLWSGTRFVPVAVLCTSPARFPLIPVFWAGYPVASNARLVDSWDLQICRIDKIVMVWWTIPIKGTITGNVPNTNTPWSTILGVSSFELPPGGLILKGYGDATTTTTILPLPSLWTISSVSTTYDAKGAFLCPSWHYFGSVFDTPTISTNVELTNTHP
jgi:hypothetical protein